MCLIQVSTIFALFQDSQTNCSNVFSSIATTKSLNKILLLDHAWINQERISLILQNYSHLRDLHNKHASMEIAPLVYLINMIAVAFNATLISSTGVPPNCTRNITTVAIQIPVRQIKLSSSQITSDKFLESRSPTVFPVTKSAFNFVYCSQPRKKGETLLPLELLKTTADYMVWACLAASSLLTSLLLKIGSRSDISEILLTTLSILLSPSVSGVSKTSRLFVLWTFTCLLFVTYYSGELTSVVISPSPEARFTNIDQLYQNKYSILSLNKLTADWGAFSVNEAIKWNNDSNKESHKRLVILQKLLSSSTLISADSDDKIWFKNLWMPGKKVAMFTYFAQTVQATCQLMGYLKIEKVPDIRCYLGQELEILELTYFQATSTGSNEVARTFLLLLEGGYYALLEKEFWLLLSFRKVRHRLMVDASLTRMLEEVQPPRPLKLSEGKLKNVFLLWGICLGTSLVTFVLEVLNIARKHVNLLSKITCIL